MKVNSKNNFFKIGILIIVSVFLISSISTFSFAFKLKDKTVNDYNYNITQNDKFGIDFCVSIEDYKSLTVEANDETYDSIRLNNCGFTSDYGKAELPTISFYVAVPQEAEVSLSYEISKVEIFQDYYVYPSQPPKPDTDGFIDPPFTKNNSFYGKNEYYPSSVVEVSPIKIIRGCRIVLVTVFPFSYNPVSKEMRIYSEINIDIDFIEGTGEFIPKRLQSIYFQSLFDAYLINANVLERASLNNPEGPVSSPQNEENRADLLIVVYDDFYEEILPLAEWRHQTGLETKVVKWSSIGTTSEDLRSYMQNAYEDWELPPSFLLIVGDADHIPVNYLYEHPYPYGGQGYTGTDLWYVAFPSDDYLPDIHEGRISVDDENELTIVVSKILEYSKNPYMDDNWFDNVLLAAKEESGRFFVWTSETIYDYLDPLGYNCIRQYQGGTPPGSTEGVIDAINNGVIIANHRDHGSSLNDPDMSSTGWSAPHFTTDHIIDDLDNGKMYPIMFSLNCESGWFDGETDTNTEHNYESIGEVGLRAEDKGFVSVIAATRVSYSGYNDELCRGFYDGMFPDFDPNYPNGESYTPYNTSVFMMAQIMNYGKFWMYDKYIIPGGCDPYPWTPDETASRVEFEMFHVHGDPTMEVWTTFPKNLTVDHPIMVNYGENIIEVYVENDEGAVEGASVCLSQENGAYAKGLTDSSGLAQLEIEIESPEEVTLIVTSHNCLFYSAYLQVGSSYPPEPPTVNGPIAGKPGMEYEYKAITTDPEGDQIFYKFDWGDGTDSGWIGPYDSGQEATESHAWSEVGNYSLKVRAKDVNDSISYWSEPYPVQIALPTIEIYRTKGGIFKITSVIRNTGLVEADDISWKISLDGGFILLGKETTGQMDTMAAGEEITIASKTILGFGPTQVIVKVDIPEGTKTLNLGGFMYLFYININYVNPSGS